jgi:CBS domain-containing protein
MQDFAERLNEPVSSILGLSRETQSLPILQPTYPLLELLHAFTQRQLHRALVVDTTNTKETSVFVITQMDLVRHVLAFNHALGSVLDLPLSAVLKRHHLHEPVTVSIHSTAWEAFYMMVNHNTSAVAVLTGTGDMAAEVDASALRGLNKARLDQLTRPVLAFLRDRYGGQLKKPMFVGEGGKRWTLEQCMNCMVRTGARRVWVTSDDKLLAMVSVTCILHMFEDEIKALDKF